jgi:ATP/maltotriose-dependent transcriptional regulator MalT
MRAGRFADADAVLAEAVSGSQATGDRRVQLRAEVERGFVRSFTRPEGSTSEIAHIAESAIPELEELGDDRALAKAWWLLSEVHVIGCRWSARAEALERALEHARKAGDAREEATLVALLAQALHYGPTPVSEAIRRCQGFLADAADDPSLEAAIASTLGGLHAMEGEFDLARRLCARAKEIYEEMGLAYRRAARSLVPAEVELLAGDPVAAERELRWGYEKLEAMGEKGARSTLAGFLARALLAQGRDGEAERFTRISEELAGSDDLVTQVVWRATRAGVLARRGEVVESERLGREALDLAEQTDFPELLGGALVALAEVIRLAGAADEARQLSRRASRTYEAKGHLVGARIVSRAGTAA